MLVSPAVDTTYILTASGPGGSATRSTAVSVREPLLHLQYDDPVAGLGKVRLVRNPSSTATHLILDLQVSTNPLTGFGVALTLPWDASKVTFTPASGLILNANVLDAGASPATAAAALPSSGPLQNTLVIGVARKKQAKTDGDVVFPAGATLFSIAFDTNGTPAEGVIFTGTSVGTKLRAALLNSARFNQIPSNTGLGLEMTVIASVIVGGAAVTGGRATFSGTLLGVVLLGAIGPALTFLGVSAYWERAIQGAIILAAVRSYV